MRQLGSYPKPFKAQVVQVRQEMAVTIIKRLYGWMLAQRDLLANGSATAKALYYTLKRWVALTRVLCPSTTTMLRTQYGHVHSDARIGCLPDRCAVANGRLQS